MVRRMRAPSRIIRADERAADTISVLKHRFKTEDAYRCPGEVPGVRYTGTHLPDALTDPVTGYGEELCDSLEDRVTVISHEDGRNDVFRQSSCRAAPV